MTKTRLEAFSDGVIAIIITIMVLELKTPHGTDWAALKPLLPVFGSYVLSFIILGIYWGNHHHLIHTAGHSTSSMLWANLHLLFWLSLIPFTTGWMGESGFSAVTVSVYSIVLTACSIAYFILLRTVVASHPNKKELLVSLKKQATKGMWSLVAYAVAIPAAFVHQAISGLIFVGVTIFWLVPDRNIERTIGNE